MATKRFHVGDLDVRTLLAEPDYGMFSILSNFVLFQGPRSNFWIEGANAELSIAGVELAGAIANVSNRN